MKSFDLQFFYKVFRIREGHLPQCRHAVDLPSWVMIVGVLQVRLLEMLVPSAHCTQHSSYINLS